MLFLWTSTTTTQKTLRIEKPESLTKKLNDVDHVIIHSRNNMLPIGNKSARPRLHILFPTRSYTDPVMYAAVKSAIQRKYQFFDQKAVDAARFFFGSNVNPSDIIWNEGFLQIDETLEKADCLEEHIEEAELAVGAIYEGSRNNTMSHYAGRLLKKYGITDKARELYMERAAKCEPPLASSELDKIWKSAIKFAKKVQEQEGYIPPEEFNDAFGSGCLKPEDYSDIGKAKVLAGECSGRLRYTSATDYIAYCGERWHEDKQKSLGVFEDFMDKQLADAHEAIHIAEENLISLGIPELDVKARSKDMKRAVPNNKIGLLFALIGADTYKKFVMKYRN